jgi:hypothetical protein
MVEVLERNLKALTAQLRSKDSVLLVGHFDALLYGFDICGEAPVSRLEEPQALNLLTCCVIENIGFHRSGESFLRRVYGTWWRCLPLLRNK